MSFQKFPDGCRLSGVRRSVALCALLSMPGVARGQSPRAANPERPTFATHAYTVAPGYIELEQGVRVQGADAPWKIHVDLNLGPVALGTGGSPLRWFHSVGAAIGGGRYGFTGEAYGYSAGAGEPAQWGALGAVTVRPAQWVVVDAGGSVGLWRDTPDLVFVGLTTNLGRVF